MTNDPASHNDPTLWVQGLDRAVSQAGFVLLLSGLALTVINWTSPIDMRLGGPLLGLVGALIWHTVRSGRARVAAHLMCWGTLVGMWLSAFFAQGLYSVSWIAVPLATTFGGLMLDKRHPWLLAMMGVIGVWAMYMLHQLGLTASETVPPGVLAVSLSAALIVSAVFGRSAATLVGRQFEIIQRAREQLLKINDDLLLNEERMRLAAQAAQFGVIEWNLETGQSFWTAEVYQMLGITQSTEATPAATLPDFIHPDDRNGLYQTIGQVIKSGQSQYLENIHRIIRADGSVRWIHFKGRVYVQSQQAGQRPSAHRLVAIISDITEQKTAQDRLEFLAFHDALTALPNRVHAEDQLKQALSNAQSRGHSLAALYLDLDGFKLINDTHGHEAGDQVLKTVAQRLATDPLKQAIPCRLGSDHFIVILPRVLSYEQLKETSEALLRRVEEPIELSDGIITVSACIGAAMYPQDGVDAQTLIRHADTALHHAKKRGARHFCVFEKEMNAELQRFVDIRDAMKQALQNQQFELLYQPQVDLSSGRMVSVEALLRWNRPGFGMIEPSEFIRIAEESGQIVAVGKWVLEQACQQAATWRAMGWDPLVMAVNISAVQLRQPGFEQQVMFALHQSGLDPRALELELTESVLLQDDDTLLETIRRWKAHGIQVALDDFGTGYSSLSYLQRYEFNRLKIDRSFMSGCGRDEGGFAIVKAIVQMARSLGITTLAEGVEDCQTRDRLQALGCDQVQGYFYSRPLSAQDLEAWRQEYLNRQTS